MATRQGIASNNGMATGSAAWKTLLQLLAGTTHAIRITRVGIHFAGVSATGAPIKVQLVRQTSAGTMTALTPLALDTAVATALETTAKHTATAEPTTTDVVWEALVHPQTGHAEQLGEGHRLIVPAATRLGLRVYADASVSATAALTFEE